MILECPDSKPYSQNPVTLSSIGWGPTQADAETMAKGRIESQVTAMETAVRLQFFLHEKLHRGCQQ